MALPGPAPKPGGKIGRTPNADWTDVPNVRFEAGRHHDLPTRFAVVEVETEDGKTKRERVERPWEEQTVEWWEVVRTLPHATLWTEADWLFATDTAYLKDVFYLGVAKAAEMTEMRRREDLLGMSAEARRKLRIRYTSAPVEREDGQVANVTPIRSGRRRTHLLED